MSFSQQTHPPNINISLNPMHTPPPLPFNPNAHHFNSAMNNVGFGFGGAGGRSAFSSGQGQGQCQQQQQQQTQPQQQGMGFGGFGFGAASAGGTGMGFGAGTGFGFGARNQASSSSSSSSTNPVSPFGQVQVQQQQSQQQSQSPGQNQSRPNLFHHPTTPGSISIASNNPLTNLKQQPPPQQSQLQSLRQQQAQQPSSSSSSITSSAKKRTRSSSPPSYQTHRASSRITTTAATSTSTSNSNSSDTSSSRPGKRTRGRSSRSDSSSNDERGGERAEDPSSMGSLRGKDDDDDDPNYAGGAGRSGGGGNRVKRLRRDLSGDPGRVRGVGSGDGTGREKSKSRSRVRGGDGIRGGGVTDDEDEDEDGEEEGEGEDVGVLLASLPTTSLLPLIHSLLQTRPSLRPLLMTLIPTPEIEDVLGVLKERARAVLGSVPLGEAGDGLVGVRVRGSLGEFCTAAMTYLPRFIIEEPSIGFQTGNNKNKNATNATNRTNDNGMITMRNENATNHNNNTTMTTRTSRTDPRRTPVHPTIPPTLLVPLSQTILAQIFPILPPKLRVRENASFDQLEALCDKVLRGWTTWVKVVARTVNTEGGMFSEGVVKAWENGLDELASWVLQRQAQVRAQQQQGQAGDALEADDPRGKKEVTIARLEKKFGDGLKRVRDEWVDSVGWMVGRSRPVEGFEGAAGEDVRMG